jgi:large-conductance mechanosensitive channel
MPIGPSHGSRGGGSSFGGGSRSGGGSRRSSSSSGGNLLGSIIGGVIGGMMTAGARRRYRESYGGGGSYENEPATPSRRRPTKYLIIAIILAFVASITMSIRTAFVNSSKEFNNSLAIMESDYYDYYKPMIEAVEGYETPTALGQSVSCGNDYYKTYATFGQTYTSYRDNPTTPGAYLDFTEDNISYYFIVYRYYDMANDVYKIGTTYTQFSANQCQALGGRIEIAYYSKVGVDSYSINTSYTSLETPEYEHYEEVAENNEDSALGFLIVFIVELALIALFVFLYIKKLKKYKQLVREDEALYQQKMQAETQEAQAKAEEAQRMAKSVGRVCKYCGCDVPDGASACPGCGSRDFE